MAAGGDELQFFEENDVDFDKLLSSLDLDEENINEFESVCDEVSTF